MAADLGDVFRPGQRCPRSGVYRVVHDPEHAPSHEVTVLFGDGFPTCNQCGQSARFELVRSARYILNDPHFWLTSRAPSTK